MISFERILLTAVATLMIAACSTPKYRCSSVDGVGCTPVENVHELAVNDELPDNQPENLDDEARNAVQAQGTTDQKYRREGFDAVSVAPGDPVLIAPRELRIWFNRWIDDAGDLYDEGYLYIRLDNGRWALGVPLQ